MDAHGLVNISILRFGECLMHPMMATDCMSAIHYKIPVLCSQYINITYQMNPPNSLPLES